MKSTEAIGEGNGRVLEHRTRARPGPRPVATDALRHPPAVDGRRAGPGPFTAWIRRSWIDDLALVDCECDPCSGTRQRRQLADTDGEFVVILITRAGRETVSQGDAEAELRPGDAVAWVEHRAGPVRGVGAAAQAQPADPAGGVGRGRRAGLGRRRGDAGRRRRRPPGCSLATSTRSSESLPELGPSAVTAARNATLELVVGRAARGRRHPSIERRPTGAAGGDGPLHRAAPARPGDRRGGDRAAAHGVSVRTVNRVFNATGQTVGEVVRVRRLARARDELADVRPRRSRRSPHRWGFADSSHFSRSFKAHYGDSPRELPGAAAQAGAAVQGAGAEVQEPAPPAADETGVTPARR